MTDTDETVTGVAGLGGSSALLPQTLHITLEVIEGPDKGKKFTMNSSRMAVGRRDADVELSDPTVSGRHAFLEYAGRLFITDNNSTNGTFVNGDEVESTPVNNMDEIKFGDTKTLLSIIEDKYAAFTPEYADDDDTGEPRVVGDLTESTIVDAPLPNPELPKNLSVVLEVIKGPAKGKKFKVGNRSTIVGRGERADFQIDDPMISKRHFQIEIHNKDKMTLKDLASSNGTRLNERYVSAVKIRHGDTVQIGNTRMRVLIHVKR